MPAGVISIALGVAWSALSTWITLPLVKPKNTLFGVYGETVADATSAVPKAAILTGINVKPD